MRNKRGSVFILLGLLLIVSSAGLSAYNLADAYYAGVQAQEALDALGFLTEATPRPLYSEEISAAAANARPVMILPVIKVMQRASNSIPTVFMKQLPKLFVNLVIW